MLADGGDSVLVPGMSPGFRVTIRHLFVSPGHNFFGHHGGPAGKHPIHEIAAVACRAGRGLEGDRFSKNAGGHKGQVTFFDWAVFSALRDEFKIPGLSPGAMRRNVLIDGADLPALIGRRFTLGGVEFEGMEESRPCDWMNSAVAPGAKEWLQGRGGLRARILTDGQLHTGAAELFVASPAMTPA